ncbi:MAG: type II toxin-antitoxin system Phd/YefM family antitoxin [Candidatus Devosia phytovorans]|uniref:Antitoxin n=1 Tax=Candidatus Devosia phytovorans TaxID=3121372 RepID=A0AAJ5VU06_9HYPH|nr:type II toxin-antitoxin system Phd/YefM family antitoxin [Devosia sp.]WEK04813.1 MAG: type II toxin-antitoxin system Phd/YefM family antitoxin [Devosia sp.]
MPAKSISAFRKDIASDIEAVSQTGIPLIVTRTGGKKPVLVIPMEWDETTYLMSNPANAERLLRSIRQANEGKAVERQLIEE